MSETRLSRRRAIVCVCDVLRHRNYFNWYKKEVNLFSFFPSTGCTASHIDSMRFPTEPRCLGGNRFSTDASVPAVVVGAQLLTTNIHEIIRVIDIQWAMAVAMAEVDEVRDVRRGSECTNLTHARPSNASHCQFTCAYIIHVYVFFVFVKYRCLSTRIEKERWRVKGFIGMQLSPPTSSMIAFSVILLMVSVVRFFYEAFRNFELCCYVPYNYFSNLFFIEIDE